MWKAYIKHCKINRLKSNKIKVVLLFSQLTPSNELGHLHTPPTHSPPFWHDGTHVPKNGKMFIDITTHQSFYREHSTRSDSSCFAFHTWQTHVFHDTTEVAFLQAPSRCSFPSTNHKVETRSYVDHRLSQSPRRQEVLNWENIDTWKRA